jgi:outer membrane lipoprotein-sorting protein
MKPLENTEKQLKNFDIQTNAEIDKLVLNEVLHAQEEYQKSKSDKLKPNLWRIIMKSKITKLAAAAVIIIAVIIGISRFGNPFESKVYAKMVEQLNKARTLTYSVLTKTNVESMPTVRTTWAYKEPGFLRTATADGFVSIFDSIKGTGISILPPEKKYMEMKLTNILEYSANDPFIIIENLRTLPSRADEELGEKEIDGQAAKGFRVTKNDATTTVWISADTDELVRVEMEFANNPVMNTVMSDFQMNVPLDDSLFSLEPPAGYEKLPFKTQADVSTVTEQDLVEFFEIWVKYWSNDGTFPPRISGPEFAKVIYALAEGKLANSQEAQPQRVNNISSMYRGGMFVGMLPAESNWRYAGNGVKIGDAAKVIFWYKPKDSQTWRVIYGDLSVKDVNEEDLPK